MSRLHERLVEIPGGACRVWEKGSGQVVGVLPGLGGFPTWTPFLEQLSQRYRVVVPSLPGFPGGSLAHKELDETLDWVICGLDLLEAAGLSGAPIVGCSVGGMWAAELACANTESIGPLALVAPFGVQDENEPTVDPYGRKTSALPDLVTEKRELWDARFETPEGVDAQDWFVSLTRAHESAARLLWPTGDRGIRKRLHRIRQDTLIVWGSDDRVIPASYAKRWADVLGGPCTVASIAGAGHLVDLDDPEALVDKIGQFLRD